MTEDFLHFIWRTKQFRFQNLRTTDGIPIEILDFGKWNTGAGPDFSMGRVLIDGTEWAGNIEMHLASSDWGLHGHTDDPAYANVVLHVVLEDDLPAFAGERKLPCVELRDRIDRRLLGQYTRLMAEASWVPCAQMLHRVDSVRRDLWLDRMLVERLEGKAENVRARLEDTGQNWDEAFYRSLATAFGFSINAAPFERLARLLPLNILLKHSNDLFQIEALVFGCAGVLNRIFTDTYPAKLREEFGHLSRKYELGMIDAHAWKWGRLRPQNFPTVRLAQFAALMQVYQGFFGEMIHVEHVQDLRDRLRQPVSAYWTSHYDFDKPGKASKLLGVASADSLLINIVAPFLYCYGTSHGDTWISDKAITLMSILPGETNSITRQWANLSMPNAHAGQSQALLHLKKTYCDARRCVECAIGNQLLTAQMQS